VSSHEPWNPWSLWCNVDIPQEALDRLVEGGIWRLVTPPDPSVPITVENYVDITQRVAIYRGRISDTRGRIDVEGKWDKPGEDWVKVGWIENN